jgi:hypothetical protein
MSSTLAYKIDNVSVSEPPQIVAQRGERSDFVVILDRRPILCTGDRRVNGSETDSVSI